MILLIGVVLAVAIAWQARPYGLYLALCEAFGVTFGGVAALAYAGKVAELVPWEHPLKGTACMLFLFAVVWVAFRTLARSFAGDYAVEFGRYVDTVGSMLAAFWATLMFVGVFSVLFLTTGALLEHEGFEFQSADSRALPSRSPPFPLQIGFGQNALDHFFCDCQ